AAIVHARPAADALPDHSAIAQRPPEAAAPAVVDGYGTGLGAGPGRSVQPGEGAADPPAVGRHDRGGAHGAAVELAGTAEFRLAPRRAEHLADRDLSQFRHRQR